MWIFVERIYELRYFLWIFVKRISQMQLNVITRLKINDADGDFT